MPPGGCGTARVFVLAVALLCGDPPPLLGPPLLCRPAAAQPTTDAPTTLGPTDSPTTAPGTLQPETAVPGNATDSDDELHAEWAVGMLATLAVFSVLGCAALVAYFATTLRAEKQRASLLAKETEMVHSFSEYGLSHYGTKQSLFAGAQLQEGDLPEPPSLSNASKLKPADAARVADAMLHTSTPTPSTDLPFSPDCFPRGPGAEFMVVPRGSVGKTLELLHIQCTQVWYSKPGDLYQELMANLKFPPELRENAHSLLREVALALWQGRDGAGGGGGGGGGVDIGPLQNLCLLLLTQEGADTDRCLLWESPVWIPCSETSKRSFESYSPRNDTILQDITSAAKDVLRTRFFGDREAAFTKLQRWIRLSTLAGMLAQPSGGPSFDPRRGSYPLYRAFKHGRDLEVGTYVLWVCPVACTASWEGVQEFLTADPSAATAAVARGTRQPPAEPSVGGSPRGSLWGTIPGIASASSLFGSLRGGGSAAPPHRQEEESSSGGNRHHHHPPHRHPHAPSFPMVLRLFGCARSLQIPSGGQYPTEGCVIVPALTPFRVESVRVQSDVTVVDLQMEDQGKHIPESDMRRFRKDVLEDAWAGEHTLDRVGFIVSGSDPRKGELGGGGGPPLPPSGTAVADPASGCVRRVPDPPLGGDATSGGAMRCHECGGPAHGLPPSLANPQGNNMSVGDMPHHGSGSHHSLGRGGLCGTAGSASGPPHPLNVKPPGHLWVSGGDASLEGAYKKRRGTAIWERSGASIRHVGHRWALCRGKGSGGGGGGRLAHLMSHDAVPQEVMPHAVVRWVRSVDGEWVEDLTVRITASQPAALASRPGGSAMYSVPAGGGTPAWGFEPGTPESIPMPFPEEHCAAAAAAAVPSPLLSPPDAVSCVSLPVSPAVALPPGQWEAFPGGGGGGYPVQSRTTSPPYPRGPPAGGGCPQGVGSRLI